MSTYANTSAVPLSMAVFLATDSYDANSATISATTLLKPLRQIILSSRVPAEDAAVDLIQMVASRMGSAIHDAIERSWTTNHEQALTLLGYPKSVIARVLINPHPSALQPDSIPIYLEQRAYKQIGQHNVSGKFDFIADGRIEDFKSTSVVGAMKHTNDEKYIQQLSIYRWLNPELVTKDEGAIQFIFTDWSSARARSETNYPPHRIMQRILPLKSVAETDNFVRRKLEQIDQYWHSEEADIPQCSDDDLWRSLPVFKYYKNPEKTARSTKNFDSRHDANLRLAIDGGTGLVLERPGQVMACKYCPAYSACTQKDALIAAGDLIL